MEKPSSTDTPTVDKKLTFPDHELMRALCGEHNSHLQILEKKIGLSVNVRGNTLLLRGWDWEVELAASVLNQLYGLLKNKYPVYRDDVEDAVRILSEDLSADLEKVFRDEVFISSKKKVITPRSLNQWKQSQIKSTNPSSRCSMN